MQHAVLNLPAIHHAKKYSIQKSYLRRNLGSRNVSSSFLEPFFQAFFKGCLSLDFSRWTWSSLTPDLLYRGKRHVRSDCRDLSDLYFCDLILTHLSFSIFHSDELHVFDFPILYKVRECAEPEL